MDPSLGVLLFLWCSTPIEDNRNLKFGGGAARKVYNLRGLGFMFISMISFFYKMHVCYLVVGLFNVAI